MKKNSVSGTHVPNGDDLLWCRWFPIGQLLSLVVTLAEVLLSAKQGSVGSESVVQYVEGKLGQIVLYVELHSFQNFQTEHNTGTNLGL